MISLVKSFFQIVYTLLIIIFLISCDAILPDDNEIVIYSWAKTFGGTEGDTIFSVTTDKLGNIYCAGRFGRDIVDNPIDVGYFVDNTAGDRRQNVIW